MKQFARYQLLAPLGGGGMAVVYRAYDPQFKREVAIKMMSKQFWHHAQFRQRFQREAEVIASLQHPAIVPVYDFGEQNGQPYLVMALIPSGSLADRLRRGVIEPAEATSLIERLAPAVDLAHQRGVVHRDLKPANILFDQQGNPYIADFGIAKLLSETTTGLSLTGMVIGTPFYMSPEQARGETNIDPRSDIYSLGAMLFEILTTQRPYEADSIAGLIYKHIHDPVPNVLTVKPDLPPGCEMVIATAMAKHPNDRYASVQEMGTRLREVVEASSVSPPTNGEVEFRISPNIKYIGVACTISGILSGMAAHYDAKTLFWWPGVIFGMAFALSGIFKSKKLALAADGGRKDGLIFFFLSTATYSAVIQLSRLIPEGLLEEYRELFYGFGGALGALILVLFTVFMSKMNAKLKTISIVTTLGLISGVIFSLTKSDLDSLLGLIPSFVIWQVTVGVSLSFYAKERSQ